MSKSIKTSGLLYSNPVKKLQQGGLTMGYGYRDPNKDMYRNLGDSALYKEGIKPATFTGGKDLQFDPNKLTPSSQPLTGPSQTVKNPPNLAFGNGLMYSKTGYNVDNGAATPEMPDTAAAGKPADVARLPSVPNMSGSTAAGVAGVANSVVQPALKMLDDKDPYTYKAKEQAGDIASGAFSGAASGIAMGAMLGTAGFPVVGTVIGAVVGGAIGYFTSRKKKKEAANNSSKRDRSKAATDMATRRRELNKLDSNLTLSAGTTYRNSGSVKREGVPGGYLSNP